jgi:murein DD-endopeptidase MepM/ murein hydrolase activator NlpD
MAKIYDVVKSPIKGKIGTINRSSGYEYRDFWYKNSSGQKVHVVGWHRAIDITTLGTIIAFAKGKVKSVVKGVKGQTTNPSGGNSVTLLHANGCKSVYCHLDNGSNNHLNVGDIVNEGDTLGTDVIKTTGNSTGLHLHFAIYNGSEYVDPTDYLQGKKTLVGYAENIPTPTPTPSGETIYVVVKGDTLSRIASLYGTTYQKLAEYNGIANPNLIYPGQHIRIPEASGKVETITYVVKSGDNLSKIAKAYNTSWQKIYEDNKDVIGKNPNLIYVGQKLIIK